MCVIDTCMFLTLTVPLLCRCIPHCVQAFSQALAQAAQDPDGCNGTAIALSQAQAVADAQGNGQAAAGEDGTA